MQANELSESCEALSSLAIVTFLHVVCVAELVTVVFLGVGCVVLQQDSVRATW